MYSEEDPAMRLCLPPCRGKKIHRYLGELQLPNPTLLRDQLEAEQLSM